ncbi:DUF4181 domain-containing protein [Mesobacillus subterraneus]|uniref:DUF4181 domain-containing protein n=1 Tax=Mesobacillus subterraneus TaxID=285983 RepID=UPI00203E5CAB|nr:DUF4181 domain-containing protein [Mesobacillus subterraneus]MCM3666259.1 DUF4181 domain-containing protein [Mesobacillus subterraneus]MCM3685258.1 DUF4181 domain-containing protein [Mesobacillus subterraneus]
MSGFKFIMLFIVIILIIAASKFILRKVFNINKVKKKAFSYHHINSTHRKVDWAVRLTALAVYLILMYQLFYHDLSINLFLFFMTLIFTSENFVRAYFEWKFSADPKQSILSIAEGVILITIVLGIIQFDVLNLLVQ